MMILLAITCYLFCPNGSVNQTIMNGTNSATGLLQFENTDLGGFLGIALAAVLFVILLGVLSFKIELTNAAAVASFITAGASLLLTQLGLMTSNDMTIFLGAMLITFIASMAAGFLKPY
jgi:ABC-type proline/glycine betaine transport system permease subunit